MRFSRPDLLAAGREPENLGPEPKNFRQTCGLLAGLRCRNAAGVGEAFCQDPELDVVSLGIAAKQFERLIQSHSEPLH